MAADPFDGGVTHATNRQYNRQNPAFADRPPPGAHLASNAQWPEPQRWHSGPEDLTEATLAKIEREGREGDRLHHAPAYDLALSRRVLCDFARGGGECCICLEPICASGPSTGLECGHIIHEQCLRRCLETPAPSCPLCREPIRSKRPSAIQYAAQQQQQVVAPQAAEVAAATAWPATVEQEEDPRGCRCC